MWRIDRSHSYILKKMEWKPIYTNTHTEGDTEGQDISLTNDRLVRRIARGKTLIQTDG